MTVPELEDALVEVIAQITCDMRYRSNVETEELAPIRVYCQFVPRNEVGEVIPGEITQYPAVVVRAKQGVQSIEYERVTVELLIGVWDDRLDQQGSRDCLQIIERIKHGLRERDIVRQRFPIRMPLNWQLNKRMQVSGGLGARGDYNNYPYFFGEMQVDFELMTSSNQYEVTRWSPDSGEGRIDVGYEWR